MRTGSATLALQVNHDIHLLMQALNILLLDDHALVVESFGELLKKLFPQDHSIHMFTSVEKAKASLQTLSYDLVLTDLIMPGQNVQEFIKHTRKTYPELIILIVSCVMDINCIKECLALGVNGYISKATHPDEISLAFKNVFSGRKFVSSDLSGRIAGSIFSIERTTLTKKELEVLRLIAAGHRTKMIAEMLHVSPITITTHKRSLLQKLNLHSAIELVKYAYENDLI